MLIVVDLDLSAFFSALIPNLLVSLFSLHSSSFLLMFDCLRCFQCFSFDSSLYQQLAEIGIQSTIITILQQCSNKSIIQQQQQSDQQEQTQQTTQQMECIIKALQTIEMLAGDSKQMTLLADNAIRQDMFLSFSSY